MLTAWSRQIGHFKFDVRLLSHVVLFEVDNPKGIRSVLYRSDAPQYTLPGREDWSYTGCDGKRYPTNNPTCAQFLVERFGGALEEPAP